MQSLLISGFHVIHWLKLCGKFWSILLKWLVIIKFSSSNWNSAHSDSSAIIHSRWKDRLDRSFVLLYSIVICDLSNWNMCARMHLLCPMDGYLLHFPLTLVYKNNMSHVNSFHLNLIHLFIHVGSKCIFVLKGALLLTMERSQLHLVLEWKGLKEMYFSVNLCCRKMYKARNIVHNTVCNVRISLGAVYFADVDSLWNSDKCNDQFLGLLLVAYPFLPPLR
jgi:hypothetical protein